MSLFIVGCLVQLVYTKFPRRVFYTPGGDGMLDRGGPVCYDWNRRSTSSKGEADGQQEAPTTEYAPTKKTPTFLLELPLAVQAGEAARLRGHLEAGRQFYNAVLSEGQRRLRQMRADPAWQAARAIPRAHTQERRAALSAPPEQYRFFAYSLLTT